MSEPATHSHDGAAWSQGAMSMESKPYALAGWLCIAQAVLFPAGLILSGIQGVVGAAAFEYRGPIFGPADLLFLMFTAFSVYTLWKFRHLLNERFNFHGADIIIPIVIAWGIVFQIATVVMRLTVPFVPGEGNLQTAFVALGVMALLSVIAGVIDILLAVSLIKSKDSLSGRIATFAYITIAAGIMELTVILVPVVGLALMPASYIVLALVFFDDREPKFV